LFTLVLQMFSWSHSICLLLYYKCSTGLIPFVYSCITNVQLVSFHLLTLVLQMYFTLELLHYAIS